MRVQKVAMRYAQVLFDLGEPLEERLHDLQKLVQLLSSMPKFQNFMASPQISINEKVDLLQKSLVGEPGLLNFLTSLLNRDRFACVPEILIGYRRMIRKNAGILDVKLITAVKIADMTKATLIQELEDSYKMKVYIDEEIDPRIVGGAILIIDNRMIDFSLKDRLSNLKNDLLALTV